MNPSMTQRTPTANAMTIDVEDYFQVSAFSNAIPRGSWEQRECRVERNMARILQMLDEAGVKATFFTLGWVAERYPQVVLDIVSGGHELASHGYGHERASDLSRDAFRADIGRAKRLLEDIGGVAVKGYRAPSFSIGKGNLWAFDCLVEEGYAYSSSIYPIQHDHYGMPDAPRTPFQVRPGLIEVPITTLRAFSRNFPSSGGGYFRLLPYALSRWMLRRVNVEDRASGIFYFHPWEIDVDQPRIVQASAKARFRHYLNIARMEQRLRQLLRDFVWDRMDRIFLANPTAVPAVALANA